MRFGGGISAASLVAAIGFGTVISASFASAQGVSPAEFPPASFSGRQYVDSTGCVFLRADYGDAVQWVPRYNRDRTPVCGFTPTFPEGAPVAAAPMSAPVTEGASEAEPAPAVEGAPPPAPKPEAEAIVAKPAPKPAPAKPAPRANAEPASGTPAPRPSAQSGTALTVVVPVAQSVPSRVPKKVDLGGLAPVVTTSSQPPGGWRPAFDDGRLNPYRGPRADYGAEQMHRRWSDTVPMEMLDTPRPTTAISTKSTAPAGTAMRPAAKGKRFVQVASFARPANAKGTKARMRALGLPVATGRSGQLTVVYAGPFDDLRALAKALASVRAAGFSDALLR